MLEMICHCLLPKAETKYLAQSYPAGFVLTAGFELMVSLFSANALSITSNWLSLANINEYHSGNILIDFHI